MHQDIYELPEVEITEAEDRIFSAAESLLSYLYLYGARVSREGMICHLEHLGVTRAQLPALLDDAERKRLILDAEPEPEQTDSLRLRAMGKLMLARLEECGLPLREKDRMLLELRFGLADGTPRTVAETAEQLQISPERVTAVEQRIFSRLSRAYRRRKRSRRIRDFCA